MSCVQAHGQGYGHRSHTDFGIPAERFARGESITKAESQKTVIETKQPVTARPNAACFSPVVFKILCAIVSAAPLFSSKAPITVPMAITTPMPEIVPPNPSE